MPVMPVTTENKPRDLTMARTMLPSRINVLGVYFNVNEVPGIAFVAEGPDGSETDVTGHIDYDQETITVAEHGPDYTKRVILIHELVHAILRVTGHAEVEEEVVRALGYGLVYLFRHNPDLVRFLEG